MNNETVIKVFAPLRKIERFEPLFSALVCHQPESIRWIVSVLFSEFVDCIIDSAADFVADFAQLFAEGELPFTFVPVIVPPRSAVAGVVPVSR